MGERKEVSDPNASRISGQRLLKRSQQMKEVDVGTVPWPELVWAPPSCQNPQWVWLSAQAYRLSPQADSSRPGSRGSTLQPWGLSADPWMELKTLHSQLLHSGHSSVPMPTCSIFSPYLPGLGCSAKTPSNNNQKTQTKKSLEAGQLYGTLGGAAPRYVTWGGLCPTVFSLFWIVGSAFFFFSFSQTFLNCVGLISYSKGGYLTQS